MIAGFVDGSTVQRRLGISRQRLHTLAVTGRIPYVWINKNRIYREKDVEKLSNELAANRPGAREAGMGIGGDAF